MKVGLGSTNSAKFKAVSEAFNLVRETIEVSKFEVDSGVSAQPTSDLEAIKGAKNRALAVREKGKFNFAVGLEGSIRDSKFGMFLTGWAFLVDETGESHLGAGGQLKLPGPIAERIRLGEELGPIIEKVSGRENVTEQSGAIGVFTNEIINRKDTYRNAVIFALAKWFNPGLYEKQAFED